jgi:RNA polymerase sigma-70 factor (ECF subfamily)
MSTDPINPDSPVAGDDLVTSLRPALVKYFQRKMGNSTEAEDLTQDVLLRALLHASWKSPEQAKGYIFRIAVNCWRDRRRRLRSHGTNIRWEDTSGEEVGTQKPPECVLGVQEELDQVAAALEQLNVRTRTVLILIKLEQMRIANVAQMLGISVSAVNKHLSKGLEHLARLRKRQEGL